MLVMFWFWSRYVGNEGHEMTEFCSVDGLLLCIKVFNEFNLLVYSIVHISSTAMNHFLKQKQMLCKKICWNLRDLNAIMSLNIDRSVYLVVTIDKNSNIVWQCINARNL